MKPKRELLVLGAIGSVVLLMGFMAGRFSVHISSGANRAESGAVVVPMNATIERNRRDDDFKAEGLATWFELSRRPHSPRADEEAAKFLETLAVRDHSAALELALKEPQRLRRARWLEAVLRGWASVAPFDASAYVAKISAEEREGAETAVMDGAVKDPTAALQLARELVRTDPARARLPANQVLRALSQGGEFEAAAEFAVHLPEEIRSEMVGTAYQYWALSQPERAFDAAVKLPVGNQREVAVDAALSGWAQGDAPGLAEFALNLSSGSDRTAALQTALCEWVQQNPKAASEWMDKFDPKPEFDAGAAAVALHPEVLAHRPEIAASWAESITDAELRSKTLASVFRDWASRDAVAALAQVRGSAFLKPADRDALIASMDGAQAAP